MRRVIVFINGAFGVGKTTVARLLRARLPGSGIFDPEFVGRALQVLPGWVVHHRSDDFQDLPQWRRLSLIGIGLTRRVRRHVIVPMAISNPDYLRELLDGARRIDPRVSHVCLTAPLDVIYQRLAGRGTRNDAAGAWAFRRAAECHVAHVSPLFAEWLPTERLSTIETADAVAQRVEAMAATEDTE